MPNSNLDDIDFNEKDIEGKISSVKYAGKIILRGAVRVAEVVIYSAVAFAILYGLSRGLESLQR